MRRTSFVLTTRLEEMVEDLIKAKGYATFSSLLHSAIMDLHSKTFPVYLRTLARDEDTESRIKRKMDDKEVRKNFVLNERKEIAEKLGGNIITNGDKEVCVYYTYSGKKRFEQIIPLSLMSEDLLKTQYQPSKEKVMQLIRDKKVEY